MVKNSTRSVMKNSPKSLTTTELRKEIAIRERNFKVKMNSGKARNLVEERKAENRLTALKKELTHRGSGIRKPKTFISVPMGGKP
jgi:hypothetical protein